MGKTSVKEYNESRIMLINEVAVTLSESGKIGALNLIFRQPLLGRFPPTSFLL